MGCFDYNCECKGKTCGHTGGQSNGATVYIEVPLSDGTSVYLNGYYEEYGYVVVETIEQGEFYFYLKEFEEYFESWFRRDSPKKLNKSFLATKVWTNFERFRTEDVYGDEIEVETYRRCFDSVNERVIEITPEIVAKCIRADKGLNTCSPVERKKQLIHEYQELVNAHKRTLEFYQNKLDALTKECP